MDQSIYVTIGRAYVILQAIPGSKDGDTVNIDIYNVTDSTSDTSSTAMTFVNGETWQHSFTPDDSDDYIATIHHPVLDVKYYKYIRSVSSAPSAGAGTRLGSTLTVLQKEFLLSIDRYNANDLTGDGSSGDRATAALNKGLQKIYSMIKDSKYMQTAPDTTSLASTAAQDYIELAAIGDLDDITNLTETTNNIKLIRIPFYRYRELSPDPSQTSGTPVHYTRLFDRIYLSPRPASAIEYTADYVKIITDLSAGADTALIPAKYNYWIYAESHVFWAIQEDPEAIAVVQNLKLHARDMAQVATGDIEASFDEAIEPDWHFGAPERPIYRFDSPVGS